MKALPWERWIGEDGRVPGKGTLRRFKTLQPAGLSVHCKKAVVERLSGKYGIHWFEESGSVHQIQFLILKDQVSIMLDTSGAGLHKRGYRANATEAANQGDIGGSHGASVPCAGCQYDRPALRLGTILIESALYALNVAPGLRRRFSAEGWSCLPQGSVGAGTPPRTGFGALGRALPCPWI